MREKNNLNIINGLRGKNETFKKIQMIIDELKTLKKQADHYERLNEFKDKKSKKVGIMKFKFKTQFHGSGN